jgi:hypothetical protein
LNRFLKARRVTVDTTSLAQLSEQTKVNLNTLFILTTQHELSRLEDLVPNKWSRMQDFEILRLLSSATGDVLDGRRHS